MDTRRLLLLVGQIVPMTPEQDILLNYVSTCTLDHVGLLSLFSP